MISKIDQYVIDKVRERRIELGVSQAVLADYIKFNKHLAIPYTPHATPLQLL